MPQSDPDHPRATLATKGEYDLDESSLGAGVAGALARLERREAPFEFGPDDLPAPGCDLAALAARPMNVPEGPRESVAFTDFAGRARNLAREMAADPKTTALEYLHACLVMALRRADPPAQVRALFFRIWDELGADLARTMPTRWRLSAAQCFAEHGRTEAERTTGAQIALMFGMVKLYEAERRFSGHPAWEAFPARAPHPGPLPMGLAPYDLSTGDLGLNIVARIVRAAEGAGAMRPIAEALLDEFDRSNRSILRRLKRMKDRQSARQSPRKD